MVLIFFVWYQQIATKEVKIDVKFQIISFAHITKTCRVSNSEILSKKILQVKVHPTPQIHTLIQGQIPISLLDIIFFSI